MRQLSIGSAVLGAAIVAVPMLGHSQAVEIGKREYFNSCAVCHGDGGKGDGPIVASLKTRPTDLTKMQKDNMGVFPIGRLYEIIDGRGAVAAHGPRDMPVWGERFKEYNSEVTELSLKYGIPKDFNAFVRDRIVALIGYIRTLQVK